MRRRTFRRRRRVKWDMQTFRDCERRVDLDTDETPSHPCSNPLIYADYLCGVGPSTAGLQNAPGASRAIVYGGGYLEYSYHVAQFSSTDQPCTFALKCITAIAKLPLLEDDLTPAYLPNLAIARSQLSVVPATESDEDEDLLYWHDRQLLATNVECDACGDGTPCMPHPSSCPSGDGVNDNMLPTIVSISTGLYGREEVTTRIKSRRRIKEREALFFLTQFIWTAACSGSFPWPVLRTVYHRYAVRVSR